MPRRRQKVVQASGTLPEHLRRGVVHVRDFVDKDERPPSYVHDSVGWWQVHQAFRRWQQAVAEWGATVGLDEAAAWRVEGGPSCSMLWLGGAQSIINGREPRR